MVNIAIPLMNIGKAAIVSPESLHFVVDVRWFGSRRVSGNNEYFYVQGRHGKNKKSVLMHRLVTNASKGELVDHADGDTLNNTLRNLRKCSHAENMRNRKFQKNKTGYPGVSMKCGRYVATVITDGKAVREYFDNPVDAHKAYLRLKNKHHGKFFRYQKNLTKFDESIGVNQIERS